MLWLYILLGVAVLLFFVMVAACLYLAKASFTRDPHTEENHRSYRDAMKNNGKADWAERMERGEDAFDAAEKEDIYLTSYDGLKLHAFLLGGNDDTDKTAILVHGYRSRGKFDYACIWQHYRQRGWRVLLIEQRAHGESEGNHICFGVRERFDLRDWVKYISDRFGKEEKIMLHGVSMGAATVMMAQDLPEVNARICAFVADCGYVSPGQQFRHIFRQRHLPYFPMFAMANAVTKLTCGFGFYEASADDALKNAICPAVFIHGTEDDFVLPESSQINYDACASADKSLIWVPGAGHATSIYADEAGYLSRLDELFAKI